MSLAVIPGSFDPFTYGHLDVVRRACTLFDTVIVGVAKNSAKSPLFSAHERVALIEETVSAMPQVRVDIVPGLLVEYCAKVQANAIVKGIRTSTDFDAEAPMAALNRRVGNIETVFIFGDPALSYVASSLVKDIARYHGDIQAFVPPHIARATYARLGGES